MEEVMQTNIKKMKLNIKIQKYIIVFLVVFGLCINVFAVQLGSPLFELPLDFDSGFVHREDIGNGQERVVCEFEPNPAWTWRSPTLDGLWYDTYGTSFDIYSEDYADGQFLVTGYFWPVYNLIDVSGLHDPTKLDAQYSADFTLNLGSDWQHSGEVYISLVPRFRLLRETGGQIAFVNAENIWTQLVPTDEAITLPVQGTQELNLEQYHDDSSFWTSVKYIEIKWQFNIRIENVSEYVGINFSVNHENLFFTYIQDRPPTDAENFQGKVDDLDNELGAITDTLETVPVPDTDSVEEIILNSYYPVDDRSLGIMSSIMGTITGTALFSAYFTILSGIVVVSYIIFGKKA